MKIMEESNHRCPNCGERMVAAQAALQRGLINGVLFGFGSSMLKIRLIANARWMTFMKPSRTADASYCRSCGSLLVAPSVARHRRELELD